MFAPTPAELAALYSPDKIVPELVGPVDVKALSTAVLKRADALKALRGITKGRTA